MFEKLSKGYAIPGAIMLKEGNVLPGRERKTKSDDVIFAEGIARAFDDGEITRHPEIKKDAFLRPSDYHRNSTSAILRTFINDIQLLPPTYKLHARSMPDSTIPPQPGPVNHLLPTLCLNLTKQELGPFHNQLSHWSRLNFLASIPELNLVLIGSQIGRVALVGLTKFKNQVQSHPEPRPPAYHHRLDLTETQSQPAPIFVSLDAYTKEHRIRPGSRSQSQVSLRLEDTITQAEASQRPTNENKKFVEIGDNEGEVYTMRVELILPLRKHEDKRSASPLIGLSVSPVWNGERKGREEIHSGKERMQGRMAWRVILHYWDHTILSYEISRDAEDGLMVF